MLVQEAINRYDVEIFDYLTRDAEVPTVDTAGCQGDVSILRVTIGAASTPLPKAGAVVVRGENGGNTHSLHGDGFFDRAENGLTVGVLTVPEGGQAVMAHPEHGFIAIAPGTYRIGRQREYAGEWRAVAD